MGFFSKLKGLSQEATREAALLHGIRVEDVERDLPMFVRWFREGRLPLDRLVTRRYTLDQINDACHALAHGEIAGRAIVVF